MALRFRNAILFLALTSVNAHGAMFVADGYRLDSVAEIVAGQDRTYRSGSELLLRYRMTFSWPECQLTCRVMIFHPELTTQILSLPCRRLRSMEGT